jgi:hypothetical protein
LNTYSKTLKAYAEQFGTKDITEAIHEAVLSEKEIRLINNEKVIKLMKYKKQANERLDKSSQIAERLRHEVGVWVDGRFVQEIEPDADKFKQLSIC